MTLIFSVRMVWEEVKRENDGENRGIWESGDHFGLGISKTLNLAHFFKYVYMSGILLADVLQDLTCLYWDSFENQQDYIITHLHGTSRSNKMLFF